jgi:hypothetical protein
MRGHHRGASLDQRLKTTLLLSGSRLSGYTEAVCWIGMLPGPVCRANPSGLRPGKCFSSFFSASFLLFLFPVFCFAISNTSLLFYFAGFELVTYLQDF